MGLFDSLESQWLEKLLPPQYKTVEPALLQDASSTSFLTYAERLLDEFIDKLDPGSDKPQKWKRSEQGYTIYLKIRRNLILLSGYDSQKNRSSMPKKFFIQWERQMVAKKDRGRCKQGTILINDRGRIIKRNIKRSPFFTGIYQRIRLLDHSLLGTSPTGTSSSPAIDPLLLNQLDNLKRITSHSPIKGVIHSRSTRLINLFQKILPELEPLDLEERHVVKRMLTTELPDLLTGYISLSPENQELRHQDLFQALCKMELTLHEFLDKIEGNRLSKVDHLLKVSKLRYDK
ncbi:hypothetical protein Q9251_10785 [Alkalihalobacillus macyae]|uniref:hypothetical protein n=1 Tax=Guptibacillus hwajinpoensis TaxID=208199 RepID=UPI00273B3B2B|nr:hypothetical protein [Alkalihalobacillus macyae]MDP4551374.1 hypothetical protein [Alkalihalobacillus macyae]